MFKPPATPSAADSLTPRAALEREFARRCQKNPRYSLRAFAKALRISPAFLSLILSGKRAPSRKSIPALAKALGLSPMDAARLQTSDLAPGLDPEVRSRVLAHREISMETFTLISDWHHLGILSLLEIPGARLDARWISRQLDIPESLARSAIARLKRLELIGRVDGRWRQIAPPMKADEHASTVATRRFQEQMLDRARHCLENTPPEGRDYTSITIAIDPADVAYARERITRFRRELAAELESRSSPRAVYSMSIQLFPLSQIPNSATPRKEPQP